MQIRDYSLPAGWFPRDSQSVSAFLKEYKAKAGEKGRAAVSPHAGWYYSGRIAALGVASLQPDADTIIVLGGHLGAGSPPVFAMEDAVRTPFGHLPIDIKLRNSLVRELDGKEDIYRDNTIEVLLPMVHYFFPDSKLLWLRLPSDMKSFTAGKIISQIASELKCRVNVLASTDLTHYGKNYGFSPCGRVKNDEALKWMRDVNDALFIKAVESQDSASVLRRAEYEQAACSAGAVLGAMGFAEEEGLGSASLLEYGTSADAEHDVPDSFVGYAALSWLE
ncbi:MAG: AmmeMemoRadiSam system protein B [Treponema sp.]|nr:AmmeMemoRadiSam system protein B [Treponema sp.]